MTDPGRNLLCVRKADVTNRDSTFSELQAAIYRLLGENWKRYWYINTSNMLLECKSNRNRVIFRGCKDDKQREKLKSITVPRGSLTDVWIEEATELTKSDFEIIDDRLRGELPPGQFYQIRMTFNPVSASHWIKRDFFDRPDSDVLTHHSTYRDNRFIDAAYYRRMERRKEVDPEGYRVYGLGDWGETKGVILRNWEILSDEEWPNCFDELAIGADWGYNHASAIYTYGLLDDNIYVFPDGIYETEKNTAELIRLADSRHFKRTIPMWCDSAEPDRIKTWQIAGYDARPVKKEKGQNGKSYESTQIDWLKGVQDPADKNSSVVDRKIYIHHSNVNFIKEISQWKWRYDSRTDTYCDEPVHFFDDAMASLRYGIEGWRKPMMIHLNTFKI